MADSSNNHHDKGSSVDDSRFEPFILPVFIALLFACSAISYIEIESVPRCFYDKATSAFLFLTVLAYLVWRAVRNSDLRQSSITSEPQKLLGSTALFSICLMPSLLVASYNIQACSDQPLPSPFYYQIAVVVVSIGFILGVIGTLSIPNAASKTQSLSKYVLVPGALISLLLSLGSAQYFGFLSNVLPPHFLTIVLDIRYLILSVAILLILFDAFLLTEGIGAVWARVQSLAEKWFRIRRVDFSSQNLLLVFGLSVLNILVGLARFIFQGVATIGFAAFDFITSLGVAVVRFVVGGGTLFGLLLSAMAICSAWMMFRSLSVIDELRHLIHGTDSGIEQLFGLFAIYYLAICLTHAQMSRSKEGRITVTLDSAAKIGGLAILGTWISSGLLHSVASITSFGDLLRLDAPGFVGWHSVGLFFWIVLGIAVAGSLYAVIWIANSKDTAPNA